MPSEGAFHAAYGMTPSELPEPSLARDGLGVGKDELPGLILRNALDRLEAPLGHRAGAFGVACDCTSTRESLVREREVPVGDPVRDADVEHSLGMVQARLGPTQNRVYPGALPFSACKVLGRADLAPVLRWQAY